MTKALDFAFIIGFHTLPPPPPPPPSDVQVSNLAKI